MWSSCQLVEKRQTLTKLTTKYRSKRGNVDITLVSM